MDLKYKNTLLKVSVKEQIIKEISERIKADFSNLAVLKYNIDLILGICNCIEEAVESKHLKLDKLETFFEIYKSLFGVQVTDIDKVQIQNIIDYLHSIGKIKRKHPIKRLIKLLIVFLLKKR